MNTHDKIKLPPLPPGYKSYEFPDGGYDADEMQAYALAAIEADRKRTADLLKNPIHVHVNMCRGIIAPITFDQLAHVLGDEATEAWLADRQRRGEPVLVGWAVSTTGGGLLHASKYTEYEARRAGYSLPLYRLTAPQPLSESDIPANPNEWKQAVDDELTAIHYTTDSFPSAKEAVKALIEWHVNVATDPVFQSAEPDLVKCAECGAEMIQVRPGKWQHPECSQSPWATEPVAWPLASPEDADKGWTLDYRFLEQVERIASQSTNYTTSVEATEQVLIAANEVLRASQHAEPVKTLIDNQEPLGEEFQRVLDEHSWDLYVKTVEPVKVPSSFPAGTEYSVEPHGNGYTIYQGRDQFHHGLNLAHLTECTPEFSKRIESALNAMSEPVNKTDWNAELASWSDEDFIRIFHERPDLANRLRKMLAEPVKVDTEALVPSDLANRLRIKAGMITMGEKIAWGSDVELMLQAAQALEIMSLPEKPL